MPSICCPEAGAIYVVDRGYVDFARLYVLHQAGAFFVTRAKSNIDAHRLFGADGSLDRHHATSHLPGRFYTRQDPRTSAAHFKDPESGKTLVFITNNFSLPAATICRSTKAASIGTLPSGSSALRIKQFYGTSEAVKTQIWIAVSDVLAPSSRSASTWTPRSTLCYRSSR